MDIETRVAKLEKENWRFRLMFGCALVGICAMALMGFGQKKVPDAIQARSFEAVNADGKVMARMSGYGGIGSLSTFRYEGELPQKLVQIGFTEGGAGGLALYDGTRMIVKIVATEKLSGGTLVLYDRGGQPILNLGSNPFGAGSIAINNRNYKRVLHLTADPDDAGELVTYDNGIPGGPQKQTGHFPGG